MIHYIIKYYHEYIITILSFDDYIIDIEKNNDIIIEINNPLTNSKEI